MASHVVETMMSLADSKVGHAHYAHNGSGGSFNSDSMDCSHFVCGAIAAAAAQCNRNDMGGAWKNAATLAAEGPGGKGWKKVNDGTTKFGDVFAYSDPDGTYSGHCGFIAKDNSNWVLDSSPHGCPGEHGDCWGAASRCGPGYRNFNLSGSTIWRYKGTPYPILWRGN